MPEKSEAPTPQSQINMILGTSNKAEQLVRIAALISAKPVTLVITANPVNRISGLSITGSPSFELLYEMLDFARDEVTKREKRALLEAVSQDAESTPQE